MADVFISYKKDDRRLAERVVGALRAEGLSIWWDDDLTPRVSFDSEIEREATAASAIVVLWTPQSAASDWVRTEADFGKEHGKLVPLQLEPCTMPLSFRLLQAADLTDWSGDRNHREWRKAVSWIKSLKDGDSKQRLPAAPAPESTPQHERKAARIPLGLIGGILAVVVVLAVLGGLFAFDLLDEGRTGKGSVAGAAGAVTYATTRPYAAGRASCAFTMPDTFYDIRFDQCLGCPKPGMKRTIFPIQSNRACALSGSDAANTIYETAVPVGPPGCPEKLFRKPGTMDCYGCPVNARPNDKGECVVEAAKTK